jgi:hypothetical protein
MWRHDAPFGMCSHATVQVYESPLMPARIIGETAPNVKETQDDMWAWPFSILDGRAWTTFMVGDCPKLQCLQGPACSVQWAMQLQGSTVGGAHPPSGSRDLSLDMKWK